MGRLERIIYESRATGSTGSLTNLATILAESHRNNARDGLTGVLAAHGDRYVQVLEGPSGALDRLMERLARDPRHRDVVVRDRHTIAARGFGDWTMASARIDAGRAQALDAVMQAGSTEATVATLKAAIAG